MSGSNFFFFNCKTKKPDTCLFSTQTIATDISKCVNFGLKFSRLTSVLAKHLAREGTYSNNMSWSLGILQLMQWSAAYVGRLLASLETVGVCISV